MALTAAPGVNSTITVTPTNGATPVVFVAASSVSSSRDRARIDVTGFGSTARTIIGGVNEAVEVTFSTYADTALFAGDSIFLLKVEMASGVDVEGVALVMSASYSGDVDSACAHEYTAIISDPTFTAT